MILNSLLVFALAAYTALSSPTTSHDDMHDSSNVPPLASSRSSSLAKRRTAKYFNEAGGTMALSHYDKRFFHGQVPYEEHRFVLRDLVRSYLAVLAAHGVETWLAHGTLLGWWWNGAIMPWDYDLDVQLSDASMQWLADNLNGTQHAHSFADGGDAIVTKSYMLDINPHHADVSRGDGMNIIDGRWIDMQNGMYVDITVLKEREASRPGVWSCKNRHRYATQDLWPMRLSEFEGVPAHIPYSFEKILADEYSAKSLVLEEYEQHRWDHAIREWVKMTPEEAQTSKAAAIERKKQELLKQDRLNV